MDSAGCTPPAAAVAPCPHPPIWELQSVLCSVQGLELLGAGVLEGNAGEQPFSVTPGHLSCVVPFVGARLVGTELPGALLGRGQKWAGREQ